MKASDVADRARVMAVLVRVQGPDPKGLKMRGHAFHLRENGITTLSLSGLLLPPSLAGSISIYSAQEGRGDGLVVTIASAVESFTIAKQRLPVDHQEAAPELIPGAAIDILLDVGKSEATAWHRAQLLSIVDVSISSAALKALGRSLNGSTDYGSWELGWMLSPMDSSLQNSGVNFIQRGVAGAHQSSMSTKVAFLWVPGLDVKKKGDFLFAMGSPFGILSPSHFLNSVSVGAIANVCSQNSRPSLFVADIRCLPGMEGGPVFDQDKSLIGIVSPPLRQKNTNTEIQIVIPWDSICASCRDLKKNREEDVFQNPAKGLNETLSSSVGKAASSVVLITVGNEAWASGLVINDCGLVLTNAHLFDPWRFRRHSREEYVGPSSSQLVREETGHNDNPVIKDGHSGMVYKGYKRIRVRLNLDAPFRWSDAKVVYISRGPLDIALLQLESIPRGIHLIIPDFICPAQGSRVHAIGHGPFGPQSDVSPFFSSGVVTKVVTSKSTLLEYQSGDEALPVMLQTTAAVYPGMSGGAIINAVNGRMIALITSNVRHAGGATLPHLNFSLPCAVLKPVFDFAEKKADKSVLEKLDKHDTLLSSIWALVPPPQPTPRSRLPLDDLKVNDGKGSRFAKFLSERSGGEVNDDLMPLLKGKLPRNMPSKL
ncbi:protease-like protein isoform X2 [Wolffia australiana]